MAAVASSDQAAELLDNLLLDPKSRNQVPENKAVNDGTKSLSGEVGENQVSSTGGAIKCSNSGVLSNGNKGSDPKKLSYQNSSFTPKGSYARGGYPTGFYSPGFYYPSFCYDSKTMGRNNDHRSYSYPNPHDARTTGQSYGYPAIYGQYMNTFGTSCGYTPYGYGWRYGDGWYPLNNVSKARNNGFSGHAKENIDGFNELNRGPRSKGFKTREATQPTILAVKEQNTPQTETLAENTSLPDAKDYNREDFPEKYTQAKFFVIKSYSEDDVHKSVKYNVWSSTLNGNKKLDAVYNEAKKESDVCPVFLLFSVNTSGQFVGLAEMTGPVDFNKTVEFWQQDKWIGCFPLKWHIIKDVPNSLLRHITLENNENKPVTNSRDTQEIKLEDGIRIVKIFKDYLSETCILDDFAFYEGRQKIIQENKAKLLQLKKQASKAIKNLDGKSSVGASNDGKDCNETTKNGLETTSLKEEVVEGEVEGESKLLKENGAAVTANDVASAC